MKIKDCDMLKSLEQIKMQTSQQRKYSYVHVNYTS